MQLSSKWLKLSQLQVMTLSCGILQPSRQLFSPKPENDWGGGKGKFLSLPWVRAISALYKDTEDSMFYLPVLKFEQDIGWSITHGQVTELLMCLLPPPHPWTTNGSSFAKICLSKAFEMIACNFFPLSASLHSRLVAGNTTLSLLKKSVEQSSPALPESVRIPQM